MRRHDKGIALISTLLFLGVMLMMALSMILTSRQRAFSGIAQHQQTQALYLAEAGLARTQVALESNLSWPGGTFQIDGIPGEYTVNIGGHGKYDSVININNAFHADSYRGPGTVPPDHALLIIDANVAGHRYVLEALVRGTGTVSGMEDAILADGKVHTKGDLRVDGITALNDSTPVDGNIQSNSHDSSDAVVWEGGGEALITGHVGAQSASASAVNMPGANILGGTDLNSSSPIPTFDIANEVANGTGANLTPLLVSFGTTPLDGGSYKYPGGTINGDIELKNDATIYIDGDVTINGSIRGDGTVWVNGKTELWGDSKITAHEDDTVALYSKGDVVLQGFDGTEFLRAAAATRPAMREALVVASQTLKNTQELIQSSPNLNSTTMDTLWNYSAVMSQHNGTGTNHSTFGDAMYDWVEVEDSIETFWGASPGDYPDADYSNVLQVLQDEAAALPPGRTQQFLQNKIEELQLIYGSMDDTVDNINDGINMDYANMDSSELIQAYDNYGLTPGLVDAVMLRYDEAGVVDEHWDVVKNLINSTSFDKIGTSYFQGSIYTQGRFYADNEVTILGSLMAHNLTNDTTPKDINGVSLKPGDIYLGNGIRVTFVEEMLKDIAGGPSGPKNLAREVWMGR